MVRTPLLIDAPENSDTDQVLVEEFDALIVTDFPTGLFLYVTRVSLQLRVREGSDWIVICLVAVCVGPCVDVPVMVTVVDWTALDFPETTPVSAFKVNPEGRVPEVTAQVTPMSDPLVIAVDETLVLYDLMVWADPPTILE